MYDKMNNVCSWTMEPVNKKKLFNYNFTMIP